MYTIGTARRGKPIGLTNIERARHIHVIGSVGTGKSKLLEYLIRQDIAAGRGLCLLDPHGTLADKIEQWCAFRGLGKLRTIHVIRPGDDSHVPGFNPLRSVPGEALSVRVDGMVAACAQAWNVRDLSETPRLEKVIRALFFALSARNLTLAEGPALLRAADPEGVRRMLTEGLPDPMFQMVWDELNGLSRRDFAEQVESTMNRLARFLASPAIRLVVGQRERAIDFRRAMDHGEVVIVNLGATTKFTYENARLLGTLIINDLFLTALGRDEATARRRPFSLYIDEAYDFLSGDIERVLDQTRKFGLHAVLAHQRLGHLKARGEGIYNAVMSITNKIVLGGLSDADAEVMTREIMRDDIDLERPKRTITMPVVTDEVPFWLEAESSSEGYSDNYAVSRSENISSQSGTSASLSETFGATGFAIGNRQSIASGTTTSEGTTTTQTTSTTEGFSRSWSKSQGRSQTLRSIREERPTTYYSLEESFHFALKKLRNLPDRAAIVKRRGERTVRVNTVEVKPLLTMPETLRRFREKSAATSPCVSTIADATAEIAERQRSMLGVSPDGVVEADFWHEEDPA
ncbi:MAG TPA: type IV secretory system conjugative DNA transfer family protein [Rhizomicrobium sp.]|jgi:hypothetical protein